MNVCVEVQSNIFQVEYKCLNDSEVMRCSCNEILASLPSNLMNFALTITSMCGRLPCHKKHQITILFAMRGNYCFNTVCSLSLPLKPLNPTVYYELCPHNNLNWWPPALL